MCHVEMFPKAVGSDGPQVAWIFTGSSRLAHSLGIPLNPQTQVLFLTIAQKGYIKKQIVSGSYICMYVYHKIKIPLHKIMKTIFYQQQL